jgi:DUF1680 family protein
MNSTRHIPSKAFQQFLTSSRLKRASAIFVGCLMAVLGAHGEEKPKASLQTGSNTSEALKAVPFDKVKMVQPFWVGLLDTNTAVSVPHVLDRSKDVLNDLQKCGQIYRGDKSQLPSQRLAGISDLFKAMEGASYSLATSKDPELERRLDEYIATIAFGQKDDGYVYGLVHECLPENYKGSAGKTRYSYDVMSHELYNVGHMYEGAIAYFLATGKDSWLKIAEKNAQHVNRVFFEGDPNYNGGKPVMKAPGHQEIELALCRLYETTGNPLYLNMAKKFIDIRGVNPEFGPFFPEYAQQHKVVRDQREAVGHAVRFTYLWAGVADLARLTGDTSYRPALDGVWEDLVDRKMYLTGGLGGGGHGESFADPYVLPNRTAYSETCAAVGNVFFNFRMYLLTGEAKYLDVAEVSLLNTSLAGVSLCGKKCNYVNPLESDGRANSKGVGGRLQWYGTACCNTNMQRFVPQIPGYMYSHDANSIALNFYAGSETEVPLETGKVKLVQESNYPFDGKIAVKVHPEKSATFQMRFRIPTWAGSERFMPGKLYSYVDGLKPQWHLTVNGKEFPSKMEKGFAVVEREWKAGDEVVLELPMPVRFNDCVEQVEANRGRIAVTRGPLVYAAEAIDNDGPPQRFYLDKTKADPRVTTIESGPLKGQSEISLAVQDVEKNAPARMRMIPYFAWGNRGDFQPMTIWQADNEALAKQSIAAISLVSSKKYGNVTASVTGYGGFIGALTDGKEPATSADAKLPRWTSYPHRNKEQVITIDFDKPRKVTQFQVYWVDDGRDTSVPASWSLERKVKGKWEDYGKYITDEYGVDKNVFNTVMCNEIKECEGLRINMQAQPGRALGIFELKIDE